MRALIRRYGSCGRRALRVVAGDGNSLTHIRASSSLISPWVINVKTLRPLWLLLLVGQFSSAQSTFTKPSEAYEYASRPVTEWDTALQEHRKPITRTRPDDVLSERSKVLCPLFALDSASGEELYFLAKLCEPDHAKALLAVSRYLAGSELAHGPDARLLLAALQMRTTGNWEAAWGTIRTILQEDPIPPVEGQIDVAIDDEARDDPQKALEWSKERYAILRRRSIAEKPGVSPVSYSFVLNAGYDLVHRYYLAGETEPAKNTLEEMNSFVKSHPDEEKVGALRTSIGQIWRCIPRPRSLSQGCWAEAHRLPM